MPSFLSKVFGRKKDDKDLSPTRVDDDGDSNDLLDGKFEAVSPSATKFPELTNDRRSRQKDRDSPFNVFRPKSRSRPSSPEPVTTRKRVEEPVPHLSLNLPGPKDESASRALGVVFEADPDAQILLSDAAIGSRRLSPLEALILVRACSEAITARGLETLGIMRPHWYSASPDVQRKLISLFLQSLAPKANITTLSPTPSALANSFESEISSTRSPHDVAAVLRWGLRHLQLEGTSLGKAETWYKTFFDAERSAGYPSNGYSTTLAPALPASHLELLTATLELFSSLAAHAEANGISGSKLSKFFGLWLLTVQRSQDDDDWAAFYDRWERNGRMLEHLFLSRIRDDATASRMPTRLLELVKRYPYQTDPTADLLARPRFSTLQYEALFVRIETELSPTAEEPSNHPLRLISEAFRAETAEDVGEHVAVWEAIRTAGATDGASSPAYLGYSHIFTDETLRFFSLVPIEKGSNESRSPSFSLYTGSARHRSSSLGEKDIATAAEVATSSVLLQPSKPPTSPTTPSTDPNSPNGLDWVTFSTSGFFEEGKRKRLASTLLQKDKDMEVTIPRPVSPKRRSFAAARKSLDVPRSIAKTPEETKSAIEGAATASPAPVPSPVPAPVVKNTSKSTHVSLVQLDEAFIDFWNDALLDPISSSWPAFIICRLKTTLPGTKVGDQPIEWLVLEQVFKRQMPPTPVSPLGGSTSSHSHGSAARVRPSSPSSGKSNTFSKMFNFFSSPTRPSMSLSGSKSKRSPGTSPRVGEMGEILAEDSERDGKDKGKKKDDTVRVRMPSPKPRKSVEVSRKSVDVSAAKKSLDGGSKSANGIASASLVAGAAAVVAAASEVSVKDSTAEPDAAKVQELVAPASPVAINGTVVETPAPEVPKEEAPTSASTTNDVSAEVSQPISKVEVHEETTNGSASAGAKNDETHAPATVVAPELEPKEITETDLLRSDANPYAPPSADLICIYPGRSQDVDGNGSTSEPEAPIPAVEEQKIVEPEDEAAPWPVDEATVADPTVHVLATTTPAVVEPEVIHTEPEPTPVVEVEEEQSLLHKPVEPISVKETSETSALTAAEPEPAQEVIAPEPQAATNAPSAIVTPETQFEESKPVETDFAPKETTIAEPESVAQTQNVLVAAAAAAPVILDSVPTEDVQEPEHVEEVAEITPAEEPPVVPTQEDIANELTVEESLPEPQEPVITETVPAQSVEITPETHTKEEVAVEEEPLEEPQETVETEDTSAPAPEVESVEAFDTEEVSNEPVPEVVSEPIQYDAAVIEESSHSDAPAVAIAESDAESIPLQAEPVPEPTPLATDDKAASAPQPTLEETSVGSAPAVPAEAPSEEPIIVIEDTPAVEEKVALDESIAQETVPEEGSLATRVEEPSDVALSLSTEGNQLVETSAEPEAVSTSEEVASIVEAPVHTKETAEPVAIEEPLPTEVTAPVEREAALAEEENVPAAQIQELVESTGVSGLEEQPKPAEATVTQVEYTPAQEEEAIVEKEGEPVVKAPEPTTEEVLEPLIEPTLEPDVEQPTAVVPAALTTEYTAEWEADTTVESSEPLVEQTIGAVEEVSHNVEVAEPEVAPEHAGENSGELVVSSTVEEALDTQPEIVAAATVEGVSEPAAKDPTPVEEAAKVLDIEATASVAETAIEENSTPTAPTPVQVVITEPIFEEAVEPSMEEPAPQDTIETLVEDVPKPIEEKTPETSAAEVPIESTVESAEEAVVEVAEPVVGEAAEPVVEEAAKHVGEVVEAVVKEAAKPVEEVAEPIVEEAVEPVEEAAVVEVAEPVVTEAANAVEEDSEPVTEEVSGFTVEEASPVVVEEHITEELIAEPVTEEAGQPTEEAVVEPNAPETSHPLEEKVSESISPETAAEEVIDDEAADTVHDDPSPDTAEEPITEQAEPVVPVSEEEAPALVEEDVTEAVAVEEQSEVVEETVATTTPVPALEEPAETPSTAPIAEDDITALPTVEAAPAVLIDASVEDVSTPSQPIEEALPAAEAPATERPTSLVIEEQHIPVVEADEVAIEKFVAPVEVDEASPVVEAEQVQVLADTVPETEEAIVEEPAVADPVAEAVDETPVATVPVAEEAPPHLLADTVPETEEAVVEEPAVANPVAEAVEETPTATVPVAEEAPPVIEEDSQTIALDVEEPAAEEPEPSRAAKEPELVPEPGREAEILATKGVESTEAVEIKSTPASGEVESAPVEEVIPTDVEASPEAEVLVKEDAPLVVKEPQPEPQPVIEEPQPETQPVVEQPQPVAEETQPVVEETQPVAEEPQPVVEETQPVVEETPVAVEEPVVVEEPPAAAEEEPAVVEVAPIVAEVVTVTEQQSAIIEEQPAGVEGTPVEAEVVEDEAPAEEKVAPVVEDTETSETPAPIEEAIEVAENGDGQSSVNEEDKGIVAAVEEVEPIPAAEEAEVVLEVETPATTSEVESKEETQPAIASVEVEHAPTSEELEPVSAPEEAEPVPVSEEVLVPEDSAVVEEVPVAEEAPAETEVVVEDDAPATGEVAPIVEDNEPSETPAVVAEATEVAANGNDHSLASDEDTKAIVASVEEPEPTPTAEEIEPAPEVEQPATSEKETQPVVASVEIESVPVSEETQPASAPEEAEAAPASEEVVSESSAVPEEAPKIEKAPLVEEEASAVAEIAPVVEDMETLETPAPVDEATEVANGNGQSHTVDGQTEEDSKDDSIVIEVNGNGHSHTVDETKGDSELPKAAISEDTNNTNTSLTTPAKE